MFNLILARGNRIKTRSILSCFIHQKPAEKENPSTVNDLTLSYLINTCGLSHHSAVSASKKINIKTTYNSDLVIKTLKSYDFTDAQITKLATKFPRLLSFSTEKILKPKLDYYLSLGYSCLNLGSFIARVPAVLMPSLEKRIKPNIEFLRSILKNDQHAINALHRSSWLITTSSILSTLPNIKTLELCGVGHANISKLIALCPRLLLQKNEKFAKYVQSAKEFGFNPSSIMFVSALFTLSSLSPLSWEKKLLVFKSLGLTQKEVETAFAKYPQFMVSSEDKIRRGFEFFRKEMKWEPSFVAAHPILISFSLEKRIKPRCSVMRVLALKGFVQHYPSLHYHFLEISETKFVKKFVTNYKERVPEVLDAYKVELK